MEFEKNKKKIQKKKLKIIIIKSYTSLLEKYIEDKYMFISKKNKLNTK